MTARSFHVEAAIRRRLAIPLCALAIGGSLVIGAKPAHALGYGGWQCGLNQVWAGQSTSGGASTQEMSGADCGTVGVEAFYQLYNGSPTYYTGYHYSASYVFVNPGNIMLGGHHKVSDCGMFDCGPETT